MKSELQFSRWTVILLTVVVSFCSIIYELLFAQTLTIMFGGTVLRYSVTIGLFMASLGVGSFLYERIKHKKHPKEQLIIVELLLSVSGVLGILFIIAMGSLDDSSSFLIQALAHIPILIVGILSGLEIPLLVSLSEENTFAEVLGVDYFGSLLGTILYGLYLYPVWGLIITGVMVPLLNVACAVLLFCAFFKTARHIKYVIVVGFLLLCALVMPISSKYQDGIEHWYYEQTISQKHSPEVIIDVTDVERTAYQDVIFFNLINPVFTDTCLNLNHHQQLCDSWGEYYHGALVDVPISMLEGRKELDVLILGGGDFAALNNLMQFEEQITSIDIVDIDKQFQSIARESDFIRRHHQDSFLDNPLLTVYARDAFTHMRTNIKKYDLVIFDLPGVQGDALLPLYSKEFFTTVRSALKEQGLFVYWYYNPEFFPIHGEIVDQTFLEAGFTRRLDYTGFRLAPDGEDYNRFQGFYVFSRDGHEPLIQETNSYTKQFWREYEHIVWEDIVVHTSPHANSIWHPNLKMVIKF